MPHDPVLQCDPRCPVWHHQRAADFPALAQAGYLPLLPVYGLVRRSGGLPLHWEEQQAEAFLTQALTGLPAAEKLLRLPPFRHVPAQQRGACFCVPLTLGWQWIAEVIQGVAASGFRHVLVVHANPLLADWLDTVLRDARVATGIQPLRLGLDGVGLQLDASPLPPVAPLQALLTACVQTAGRSAA